jgi:flagellar biogenesis protein FliO
MMHGYSDNWNWYWMVPTMLALVVLIGAVVYAAVRLANRDS